MIVGTSKRQNKITKYSIAAFSALMLSLFVLSFCGIKAFDEIYFYMSSIIIFISAVMAYTFFGYSQTREGKLMCCMSFLFAASTVIIGLLTESVFVIGNPLSVVYPVLAIYYLFIISYMYPDRTFGKKPLSFIIAVLSLVLFELTLVIDNPLYNTILTMLFMLILSVLSIYNIIKGNRIGYNALVGLVNIIGIIGSIVIFCNVEWVDTMNKIVSNSQVFIAELILFSHCFVKNTDTED